MSTTQTYRAELVKVAEMADWERSEGSESACEAIAPAVAARVLADALAVLHARNWHLAAGELRDAFRARGIEVGE